MTPPALLPTPPVGSATNAASVQSAPSTQAPPENAAERSDLRKAAQAFEAIFLRQMLASARASSIAEQTPFTGPGLDQFTAMRDEQFAEIASHNGGLGLADQIERQLTSLMQQSGR